MDVFTRTEAEGNPEYRRSACLTRHTEYVERVYERRKEKLTIKYNKKGSVW